MTSAIEPQLVVFAAALAPAFFGVCVLLGLRRDAPVARPLPI
jgi:hypothetical protein